MSRLATGPCATKLAKDRHGKAIFEAEKEGVGWGKGEVEINREKQRLGPDKSKRKKGGKKKIPCGGGLNSLYLQEKKRGGTGHSGKREGEGFEGEVGLKRGDGTWGPGCT